MSREARILLLCDDRPVRANTVRDHIDALVRFSRHQVRPFNPLSMRRSLALELGDFDAVVIHYSVDLSDSLHVSPHFRDRLRRFRGLKVEFLQDDYRWVDRTTAAARDAGIGVLFTIAPEPAAGLLYDERLPGVRRVLTLTGYVPDNLMGLPVKPLAERTLDVGYRARALPFWFGRLSQEKVWVGQRFAELAPRYGLRCDIAWHEHDRIYGQQWIDFMSSCRATLGCGSGASIADFDGSAERAVQGYLRDHPAASYEEVHDAVLRPYEGKVVVDVVSPRVFEAAALGTAMIMFPGDYSGVVSPREHYIVLEEDFSNMDEVVEKLRDGGLVSAMTARTHHDVIESRRWSYQAFVSEFDQVVDEEVGAPRGRMPAVRYRLARAERAMRVPPLSVRAVRAAHATWRRVFRRDRSMSFTIDYESQVEKGLLALRIAAVDRDLRLLLWLGRRAGAPLDRVLREVLELSLLRRAAAGELPAQAFRLNAGFDAATKALSFVSVPVDVGAPPKDNHAQAALDVLRAGELSSIDWDHRAMGGLIHLDRPAMEVGIGFQGLESFTVLAGIGRATPAALARALGPALSISKTDRVTDSVG